MTKSLQLIPSD
uniref:Uncharacterized protein n=1 Tax=Rhizophora mucronata TaxID=61149 RepID=A0A2P2QJ81_RHIMU